MRVCLVGHFSGQPDNRGDLGVKQVALEIAKRLRERHETIVIDIKRPPSWWVVRRFKPEILHFVLGPSTIGLVAARLLAEYWRPAKTVMSAPNPDIVSLRLGALFRPDLVLVQSYESETMFKTMGCNTTFLPNGVDVETFRPVAAQRRMEVRDRFSLSRDRFVILHVGPMIKSRDVKSLAKLQTAEQQVVIVGRTAPVDSDVHQLLTDKGCVVITDYVEHIEEIYALSDCYVFPTPPANKQASIEMPLSVLEAMSCNLPVVTTRFGALPRAFEEGDGLTFVDSDQTVVQEVDRVKKGVEVRTRDTVLPYAWDYVVSGLEAIYGESAETPIAQEKRSSTLPQDSG